MKPRKFDKGERPFNKFREERPRRSAEGADERSFRKPFARDSRPPFDDDEQFTATGELADIVGTHPLDRREILRRMWRHYQDAGLVKSIGGGSRRPPHARPERPARSFEDRRPRATASREGGEDRPRKFERRREDGPPRRAEGERRSPRDRDDSPKKYARKPSLGPRVSTRKPSGKHPAGKRAETLSKVPRRKFKDTRERDEG